MAHAAKNDNSMFATHYLKYTFQDAKGIWQKHWSGPKKRNLLKATEMVNLDHIFIFIDLNKLLQTALIPQFSIISNI